MGERTENEGDAFNLEGGVDCQLCFNLLGLLSFMYRWWVVVHMFVCLLQLKGGFIWDILLSLIPMFGEVLVTFHGVFSLV